MTPGRSWRGLPPHRLTAVRELLLRAGGVADSDVTGPYEAWRIRLGRAVFTGYSTGTVYCGGGSEPELEFLYGRLDAAVLP